LSLFVSGVFTGEERVEGAGCCGGETVNGIAHVIDLMFSFGLLWVEMRDYCILIDGRMDGLLLLELDDDG